MIVFEKIIEKLEEMKMNYFLTIANTGDKKSDVIYESVGNTIDKSIEIVKNVAEEHNNGWILCGERMPEEDGVAVLLQDMEGNYSLGVSETKGKFKGFIEGYQWASSDCYKYWKLLTEPLDL